MTKTHAVAALVVVIGAGIIGFALGSSGSPNSADARAEREAAFQRSYHLSLTAARDQAKETGFKRGIEQGRSQGNHDGLKAGGEDGESAAKEKAAVLAAQESATIAEEPPVATSGCPPGTDAFGTPPACIAQPAPGVSPEYDLCVAEGGTPSPDGCLRP